MLIGSEYLISYLKKWRPSNGVSRISIEFLMYLLDRLPVIERIRNELVVRRRRFFIELGKLMPEWKAIETKANFVLLQTQEPASASWLAHRMRESGIIVKHLASNDTLTSFLRITVPSKDEMEAVLTVLSDTASEWLMGKGGK
ncbi:histidinol-phosphate aminotransferase [compost metagenome]